MKKISSVFIMTGIVLIAMMLPFQSFALNGSNNDGVNILPESQVSKI